MSPPSYTSTLPPKRFPRVSGDEPCVTRVTKLVWVFSPRERG